MTAAIFFCMVLVLSRVVCRLSAVIPVCNMSNDMQAKSLVMQTADG